MERGNQKLFMRRIILTRILKSIWEGILINRKAQSMEVYLSLERKWAKMQRDIRCVSFWIANAECKVEVGSDTWKGNLETDWLGTEWIKETEMYYSPNTKSLTTWNQPITKSIFLLLNGNQGNQKFSIIY
jgi:hypothetical protein